MNANKISGYFYICKRCKKVIHTNLGNIPVKKLPDICKRCFAKYRHEFVNKRIIVTCGECGKEFKFLHHGHGKKEFCESCADKRRYIAWIRFKREYNKTRRKLYTELGTLTPAKRATNFEEEMKKIKWLKKQWLSQNKNAKNYSESDDDKVNEVSELDVFSKFYDEYQQMMSSPSWYWDDKVYDFVTDYVPVWLYGTKPEVY